MIAAIDCLKQVQSWLVGCLATVPITSPTTGVFVCIDLHQLAQAKTFGFVYFTLERTWYTASLLYVISGRN